MITDGFRETISSLLALKIWKTQIYIAAGKKQTNKLQVHPYKFTIYFIYLFAEIML